jgi:uncharacterized protein YgiM (DUF1202 family)
MRNILPVAVLALTVAMAGGAQAGSTSAPSGNAGTNVGDSLNEPMVVTADNGNVREQPNAQAKLLTTVPHRERVVMIGTANGGAWAHVMVDGVDGYMDLVQLAKAPPAESTSTFTTEQSAPRYMTVTADSANVRQRPSNDSALLVTLLRGTRVVVVGSDQGWARIHGSDHDGYVEVTKLADATSSYGGTYYAPSSSTSVPTYQHQPSYQYQPNGQTYQYQQGYQYQPTYQYQPNGQGYPPAMRVVNGGGGTIHQAPDSRSPLLGTVPPGYSVQVLGTVDGGWAHVVTNGLDGYMSHNQLQ